MDPTTVMVVASLAFVAIAGIGFERRRQHRARRAVARAAEMGLEDPPSLHPSIDPSRCIGCGSCVEACPEDDVLRVIDGRARLVNAAHCVGHGQCKTVCPTQAIELVFGTATRGVLVPLLGDDLQTSVPGIYVAGELGGFGLIRTAVAQGIEVVRHLKPAATRDPGAIDAAIVGAGPAGIAAALACRERGLTHLVLDQDGLGGSVHHYPRRKLVMTAPVKLPIVGMMDFHEISKEELVSYWRHVVSQADLKLRGPARVSSIDRAGDSFRLKWDDGEILARRVILATGRRGSPRTLRIPGEESPNVAYRLLEPDQYAAQRVLVVGGGNSALEAAISLAEAGARVVLSYRGDRFARVAPANLRRLDELRGPALEVILRSEARRIEKERVLLQDGSGERWIPNDHVFVLIGGDLPTSFLEKIGVATTTYYGEPPRAPREASAPGPA